MMVKEHQAHTRPIGAAWGVALALSAAILVGCDDLLEVELPAAVTHDALEDPSAAPVQVNGLIGQIECGWSSFAYNAGGYEDNFQKIAGTSGPYSEYTSAPGDGTCDDTDDDFDWFVPLMIGRAQAFKTYARLEGWSDEQVQDREKLMATTALYAAVALDVFGEHFCEMAIDAGPLMTPDQTLDLAEQWVATALDHVANAGGDFELPNGITGEVDGRGIEPMAYALLARIRWARGPEHWADARTAALNVPRDYTAWVTRETGPQRRNKVYQHTIGAFGKLLGTIGASIWDDPEPGSVSHFSNSVWTANGEWPDPIPFTGYLFLGVTPDGRAVDDDGYPIVTRQVDLDGRPIPGTEIAGMVADTRVQHEIRPIQGPDPEQVALKYASEADDMPLVSWRETWLILAEIEGGQSAIDRVNVLRAFHRLPAVSYIDGTASDDEIENMIIEERRRELWLEGRYWATKIQHTDKLWFPRNHGEWPTGGYGLEGGVRLAMPETEYQVNEHLDLTARGAGCAPGQAPVIVS